MTVRYRLLYNYITSYPWTMKQALLDLELTAEKLLQPAQPDTCNRPIPARPDRRAGGPAPRRAGHTMLRVWAAALMLAYVLPRLNVYKCCC